MESKSHTPDVSLYFSAPGSPSLCSPNSMQFYSAPTSPIKRMGNDPPGYQIETPKTNEDVSSNFGDFEFETSLKFDCYSEFETSQTFECLQEDEQRQQEQKRQRGDSLPGMAFADELFSNGQVLPLKLPPRLQSGNDLKRDGQRSIPSSPRSPGSVLRIAFGRRMTWNDDFDPFMVALQKVREEKRGRSTGNNHRRTRSHSPFRASTFHLSNDSEEWYNNNIGGLVEPLQHSNEPMESKGSTYSERVPQETKQVEPSSQMPTKRKGLQFCRKVRVKMEHEGPIKSESVKFLESVLETNYESSEEKRGAVNKETKVQRIKGILLRFASFGREKNEGKATNQEVAEKRKTNYFNRLSFKFKGNGRGNGKKGISGDSKMAVIQYRAKLPLCLGYGLGSPRSVN